MKTNDFSRMHTFHILGVMSGTSLDGLDLAYCSFLKTEKGWESNILTAECLDWNTEWKNKLSGLFYAPAGEIFKLDMELGHYIGSACRVFCSKNNIRPMAIASHGHTIFHQPSLGYTTQIGHGAAISASSGMPVVSDFRSMDVALGGQGAPLVPIGDELLFQKYSACLNLGGIANISFQKDGKRLAFDIGPFNQVLNFLAQKKGLEYDKDGLLARKGTLNPELFEKLNQLDFYNLKYPKSLGREWVDATFLPVINGFEHVEELLHTCVEHFAFQIAHSIPYNSETQNVILVTGGGAFNSYFLERLQFHLPKEIKVEVPANTLISFKEAYIFAFLGLLRILQIPNTLASVTGSTKDNIGGAMYGDFSNVF